MDLQRIGWEEKDVLCLAKVLTEMEKKYPYRVNNFISNVRVNSRTCVVERAVGVLNFALFLGALPVLLDRQADGREEYLRAMMGLHRVDIAKAVIDRATRQEKKHRNNNP